MKRIFGFILGLAFAVQIQNAEAQSSSTCAVKIASVGARLVGGASLEDVLNIRRGQIITNILTKNPTRSADFYTFELLDGGNRHSRPFLAGEIGINPRNNKIVTLRFSDQTENNSPGRIEKTIRATDAALSLYGLNRPDAGSQIEVNVINRRPSEIELMISDRSNSAWGQRVQVQFDRFDRIILVEMGLGFWERDEGIYQVASAAGRMVGGAALEARGLRRGNLVTNLRSSSLQQPRGELLNGTNAGGRPLAEFAVRFGDLSSASIDQVDIYTASQAPRQRALSPNEVAVYARDAVLGLYNINRPDGNPGTMASSPRFEGRGNINGVAANIYQVDVLSPATERNPEQSFSYRIWINENMVDPVLRVQRLD